MSLILPPCESVKSGGKNICCGPTVAAVDKYTGGETDDERLLSNGNQGLVAVACFIYSYSSSE